MNIFNVPRKIPTSCVVRGSSKIAFSYSHAAAVGVVGDFSSAFHFHVHSRVRGRKESAAWKWRIQNVLGTPFEKRRLYLIYKEYTQGVNHEFCSKLVGNPNRVH